MSASTISCSQVSRPPASVPVWQSHEMPHQQHRAETGCQKEQALFQTLTQFFLVSSPQADAST